MNLTKGREDALHLLLRYAARTWRLHGSCGGCTGHAVAARRPTSKTSFWSSFEMPMPESITSNRTSLLPLASSAAQVARRCTNPFAVNLSAFHTKLMNT